MGRLRKSVAHKIQTTEAVSTNSANAASLQANESAFRVDLLPFEPNGLHAGGLEETHPVTSFGKAKGEYRKWRDLADRPVICTRKEDDDQACVNKLLPLAIRYQKINQLKPRAGNPRTHSKRQIKQIARSIEEFGFLNPVIVDKTNRIVAGHGRVLAATLIGMIEIPTICIEDLSEDQIRAYVIADNQLAVNAGWDKSILSIELQHLILSDELELEITGFESCEIDLIIGDSTAAKPAEEETPIISVNQQPVSQRGDHWLLRNHHIVCGDALLPESCEMLMGGRKADVAFNDVPYNVPINGHATGNGKIKHRDFAMAVGEQSAAEFQRFLSTSLGNIARHTKNGSIHFICMDFRHMSELLSACASIFDRLLNLCVWCKNNGGMGSLYRSQHELVFVYKYGRAAHRNNIQLGKWGRNRANVWNYPNVATQSKQGDEGNLLAMHPTVKPITMVADALLDVSARGDRVIDGFLGSGTTLMAAERVGRICHGLEIDPVYVDTAIRRWQRHTGELATHAESGRSFDEIERELQGGERG